MTSSIPLALQAVCVESTMASSSPQFSLETQGKETIFSKSSERKSLWKSLFDSGARTHSFSDPIPEIRLIGHPVEQDMVMCPPLLPRNRWVRISKRTEWFLIKKRKFLSPKYREGVIGRSVQQVFRKLWPFYYDFM